MLHMNKAPIFAAEFADDLMNQLQEYRRVNLFSCFKQMTEQNKWKAPSGSLVKTNFDACFDRSNKMGIIVRDKDGFV